MLHKMELIKPILQLDHDETLVKFIPKLNEFYNNKFNKNLKLEDYSNYELSKSWKCSEDKVLRILDEFYETDSFKNLPINEGAQEALEKLVKWYNPIVVSARPSKVMNITRRQIDKYFKMIPLENVFHSYFPGDNGNSPKITKSDWALKYGAKVGVEDCWKNAKDLSQNANVRMYLLSKPWNKYISVKLPNIIRVNSWERILQKESSY